MKRHNLFIYGTLLSSETRKAVIGRCPPHRRATLSGYGRYKLKDKAYPAAVPEPSAEIDGLVLLGLTEEELHRLDQYEGPEYKRLLVEVVLEDGRKLEAFVYLYREEYYDEIEPSEWHPDDFTLYQDSRDQDY